MIQKLIFFLSFCCDPYENHDFFDEIFALDMTQNWIFSNSATLLAALPSIVSI